jgi:hypothetical protein
MAVTAELKTMCASSTEEELLKQLAVRLRGDEESYVAFIGDIRVCKGYSPSNARRQAAKIIADLKAA